MNNLRDKFILLDRGLSKKKNRCKGYSINYWIVLYARLVHSFIPNLLTRINAFKQEKKKPRNSALHYWKFEFNAPLLQIVNKIILTSAT